jgi:hypothetical protein
MTKDKALEIWAPPESVWSRFASPVLFSFMETLKVHTPEDAPKKWNVPLQTDIALLVDAPGSDGVSIGLSLAARGYRPVPLYNACPFATISRHSHVEYPVPPAVEVTAIMSALFDEAETLGGYILPDSAPPAFLLDANRAANPGSVTYELFDNRSFVSALDVPDASTLKKHRISGAVVVHNKQKLQPDLLFILLEWQREGLRIFFQSPWRTWEPQPVVLKRPWAIISMYHRLAMRTGFHRRHLGGFGTLVQPGATGSG